MLLTLMRHDFPAYRSNLNAGSEIRAWDTGQIISAVRSQCDHCSWVWNPIVGGTKTPMVIKHINSVCPTHGRYRGDRARS